MPRLLDFALHFFRLAFLVVELDDLDDDDLVEDDLVDLLLELVESATVRTSVDLTHCLSSSIR